MISPLLNRYVFLYALLYDDCGVTTVPFVIQDSMNRTHDVTADSPYSQFDLSPAVPSTAAAHKQHPRNLKRSIGDVQGNSTKQKQESTRRPPATDEMNSLDLYMSSSGDELDSMQYSSQPTRPFDLNSKSSSVGLPFKVYED